MLDSLKITRRQSEIRQQLAGLVGKDTPTTDETRSMETLDAEYRTNETRFRAALVSEDTERREAGAELETRSEKDWNATISCRSRHTRNCLTPCQIYRCFAAPAMPAKPELRWGTSL